MKKNVGIILIALIAVFASCQKEHYGPKTFNGPMVKIDNGRAHTFITLKASGTPAVIGIRMSTGALQGLPTHGGSQSFMLNLPQEAGLSGYDHCEVDWNPHGHDPLFAYGVPHFDFHFYMITRQEESEVKAGPDTIPVAPQYVPRDYVSGVIAVPDMGTHWADTTAPEFNGQPFTATFIYGFYHGKMTFLEPMVTKAFLETSPDAILPVKQPQAFQRHGYYPTQYHVSYDARNKEYVIALEGLTFR